MIAQELSLNHQWMVANRYPGQPMTVFGLPVEKDIIFRNHKGIYKAAIEKRQRRLIIKNTFVKFFLNPDERILCLTTGYSPVSTVEQILTGPAFLFFKRAYFLFTNHRILHIPIRANYSSPSAISQILYEDCVRICIKGRSLVVHYKNGKHECFPHISSKERLRIHGLLNKLTLKPKVVGHSHGRSYICPSCTHELVEKTMICGVCGLKFKSDIQANIRALIIPGGGYFYHRYPVLGFTIGSLEVALSSFLVFQLSNLIGGAPVKYYIPAMLVLSLIIEKIIASFHSRQLTRDYIPEEQEFALRKV